MSDDNYGDLHAWIEPEIEARIVAAILGESSDFERDELKRLMEERPELRIFKRRLEAVHGLIGEAVKKESGDEWKLSPKRRAALMDVIGAKPAETGVAAMPTETTRERRIGKAGRRVLAMAAACLLLTLILVPLAMPRWFKTRIGADGESGIASESKRFLMEDSAPGIVTDRFFADGGRTKETAREFRYEAEYEPPELPNALGAPATKGPAKPSRPLAALEDSKQPAGESDMKQRLAELRDNLGSVSFGLDAEGQTDHATFARAKVAPMTGTASGISGGIIAANSVADAPVPVPLRKANAITELSDGLSVLSEGIVEEKARGFYRLAQPGSDAIKDGQWAYNAARDEGRGTDKAPTTRLATDDALGLPDMAQSNFSVPTAPATPRPTAGPVAAALVMPEDESSDRSRFREGFEGESGEPIVGRQAVKKKAAADPFGDSGGEAGFGVIAGGAIVPTESAKSPAPPTSSWAAVIPAGIDADDFGTGWGSGGGGGAGVAGGSQGWDSGEHPPADAAPKLDSPVVAGRLFGNGTAGAPQEKDASGDEWIVDSDPQAESASESVNGIATGGFRPASQAPAQRGGQRGRAVPLWVETDVDGYAGTNLSKGVAEKNGSAPESTTLSIVEKQAGQKAIADSSFGARLTAERRDGETREESLARLSGLVDRMSNFDVPSREAEPGVHWGEPASGDVAARGKGWEREFDRQRDGKESFAGKKLNREEEVEQLAKNSKQLSDLEETSESLMELQEGRNEMARKLQTKTRGVAAKEEARRSSLSLESKSGSKDGEADALRRELYQAEGNLNLGRYDEAATYFERALREDPTNEAARQGLAQVEKFKADPQAGAYDETRARILRDVDAAWEQPVPDDSIELGGAVATTPADDPFMGPQVADGGVIANYSKLRNIIIPRVDFEDTTVEEAVDFLRQRTQELDTFELDPARKGMNFVLRKGRVAAGQVLDAELDGEVDLGAPDPGQARIKDLKLENVSLGTVLDHIAAQSKMRYQLDDHAITMLPLSAGEGEDLVTRSFPVQPNFLEALNSQDAVGSGDDPFASGGNSALALKPRRPVVDVFKEQGISFPAGASATYVPGSNTLVVKNTASNLDLVSDLASNVGPGPEPVDADLFSRLGTSGPGNGHQAKLTNIVLPIVDFENVTVEDAVHFIEQRSRALDGAEVDPAKKGVRFEIAAADDGAEAKSSLGRITELKLRNVPVEAALQYMADQAGFSYTVGDDGIKILPGGHGDEEPVVTREWRVHPEVIADLQERMNVDDDVADPFADDMAEEARVEWKNRPLAELLKENGIAFPEGSSVRYSPVSSTLVVRNNPSNLELVDVLFETVARNVTLEQKQEEALTEDEKTAAAEPFSTFSLHVSDVSFKLAQAALANGEWPDPERVRVEEFVNALDYGDPAPSQEEKVACQVEQAVHPFLQQRNMLRVSMRTAALGRNAGTPLRLTVLLDNSGSMDRADRVESVQRAFQLLAAQMNPQDELTLISFARTPRLLRESVAGDKVGELVQVLRQTPSEGGTNLEQALRLGVEKAKENFLDGAQNRIVLLTDGAANLGNAQPTELMNLVESMRQEGIAFDACGVGAEGLNDEILESLTRKGDGRYYFLDRPEDADAGFAKQIAGALRPAAKNVKVQVEFNPKRVGSYKLLGFEKHRLKKEDFRNDSVDAAEMAAEEEGVAVYQVEAMPEGEGEVGTVSVRFRDMDSGQMVERKWTIPYEANPSRVEDAAPSLQLAASAAMLAERLKGTPAGEVVNLGDVERWTRNLQSVYPKNERVRRLHQMTAQAREMAP